MFSTHGSKSSPTRRSAKVANVEQVGLDIEDADDLVVSQLESNRR